jgi:hypothetical protein
MTNSSVNVMVQHIFFMADEAPPGRGMPKGKSYGPSPNRLNLSNAAAQS